MQKLPHDLLPIKRPLEDTTKLPETYFYDNVVRYLIPDFVKIEASGIPIDLKKVEVLEETVLEVLERVRERLQGNTMMMEFLEAVATAENARKIETLEDKKRTVEDYLQPFDLKKSVHKSALVNYYLATIGKSDMCMDKWTVKDLKKLNHIIASKFISDLLAGKLEEYMQPLIKEVENTLAQAKADIFNKSIEGKIEKLDETSLLKGFNPGSSKQKQEFFEYWDIEAENQTPAGNPQWDRAALTDLRNLVASLLDVEEHVGDKDGSDG